MTMQAAVNLWRSVADWELEKFGHAKSYLSFPVDGSGVDRVELVLNPSEYGSLPLNDLIEKAEISNAEAVVERGLLVIR